MRMNMESVRECVRRACQRQGKEFTSHTSLMVAKSWQRTLETFQIAFSQQANEVEVLAADLVTAYEQIPAELDGPFTLDHLLMDIAPLRKRHANDY